MASKFYILLLLLIVKGRSIAQISGIRNVISNEYESSYVLSGDIDGDNFNDILYILPYENKIVWKRNLKNGQFSDEEILYEGGSFPLRFDIGDIDSDGDVDVLFSIMFSNIIAWLENDGNPPFNHHNIATIREPYSVKLSDVDNDGDLDMVAGESLELPFEADSARIVWSENDGNGNFSPYSVIHGGLNSIVDIHVKDLDGDNYPEVMMASYSMHRFSWYENNANGTFGQQHILNNNVGWGKSIFAIDLDNDGDNDVLGCGLDSSITWYENNGGGDFSSKKQIDKTQEGARRVHSVDLDGDGDNDVLCASRDDNTIAWYENHLNGRWGAKQVISNQALKARFVTTSDLDLDGDQDVITISQDDNTIAWYENLYDHGFLESIDELPNDAVTMYPNPATTKVSIGLGNILESDVRVEIVDLMGKLVYVKETPVALSFGVELGSFERGIYIVNVIQGDGVVWSDKLVVE